MKPGHVFALIMSHVLLWEGGYVDHPEDPGGATNMGITLKTLRAWRGRPDLGKSAVRDLSGEEAMAIYRDLYWKRIRGDDLPPVMAAMCLDAAINQGVYQAGLFLQRAIRTAPDGVIGSQTLRAANARRDGREIETVIEIAAMRMEHYGNLSTFQTFGLGWARRLMATLSLCHDVARRAKEEDQSHDN